MVATQRFVYELITPERASEMLAKSHPRQRRSGHKKVVAYARTMTDGRWNDHVPQPVMVSPDGLTLNGGHRLAAIVSSGISTMLLVAYDVPADVFDVIDVGSPRQPRQFIAGFRPVDQATCVRWLLWAEQRFDRAPSSMSLTFDLDEVIDELDLNADEIVEAVTASAAANKASRVPVGVHAAALILARRAGADPERLASWIEGVTTGANLAEGDPRLHLRERFIVPAKGRTRADPRTNWYVVVMSLNAYLGDETIGPLKSPRTVDAWPMAGESPAGYRKRAMTIGQARRRKRSRVTSAAPQVTFGEVSMAAAGGS